MPKADGVFYFLVDDVFGRDTRFDLEYVSWDPPDCKATSGQGDRPSLTERIHYYRNRIWDSATSGTSVSGAQKWAWC
jgi:hypothetical protein